VVGGHRALWGPCSSVRRRLCMVCDLVLFGGRVLGYGWDKKVFYISLIPNTFTYPLTKLHLVLSFIICMKCSGLCCESDHG